MSSHYDLIEMGNLGFTLLEFAAAVAALIACIVYRRASGAMPLLIAAFAVGALSGFLYLVMGLGYRFLDELEPETWNLVEFIAHFFGLASAGLLAVGLFLVFADVTRRADRARAAGRPDDDYGRRPPPDRGDEPRWGPRPGGPDIRR
jgi:hypothetical protein